LAKKSRSGGYTVTSADKEAFVERFADIIHDISPIVGIAPEIMLAQAGHESRWGRSGLVDRANNYFGIKGKYEGDSVRMRTREVNKKGKSYYTNAHFRAYPDATASFKDWGRLMGKPAYDRVRAAKDVPTQIAALGKSKYATEHDRVYTNRLRDNVEFVSSHPAFQEARKAFQSDLIQEQVGIPDVPAPVNMGLFGPTVAPAPVDPMSVPIQPFDNFKGILDDAGFPEREPPATFDERYAPSGPMPPGSFGDYLGSSGNDHLIGDDRLYDTKPASAGFFNDRYEGDGLPIGSAAFGRPIGDWEFGSQAAPMVGPASMAYGLDFETAPDPFAPTAAPDWFNDRLAEPSLYGPSFGLDTAMSGSRTSPTAPGRLGSEVTPEFTPHVPEWAQQSLDQMPDYDHLGAPPMGGYTPPAPPQDYTAPPSLLADMNIGGAVADRLNTPSGYGSDYMTPSYARDEMEAARSALTAGLGERAARLTGVTADAAPSKPRFEPEPIQRYTERTVYDTKMVPEKYTVDVPVEQSFSRANVGKALPDVKPTSFADLGLMSGLMTGNPWSDALHEKAKEVGKPFKGINDIGPLPGLTRREERTRMTPQRVERIERTPIPTPMRAPMVTPELPSFARATPQAGFGITPVGPAGWPGMGSFQSAPSLSQSFAMAGNSLFGGLSDSLLSALGYGPGSSFTGGWGGLGSGPDGSGQAWGDGGPGGYGGGSVYDGNSGPYAGGDARFDGGWGGMADSDTYR
jgi:hypothetical protein